MSQKQRRNRAETEERNEGEREEWGSLRGRHARECLSFDVRTAEFKGNGSYGQ